VRAARARPQAQVSNPGEFWALQLKRCGAGQCRCAQAVRSRPTHMAVKATADIGTIGWAKSVLRRERASRDEARVSSVLGRKD
jgi:hypothetical protein